MADRPELLAEPVPYVDYDELLSLAFAPAELLSLEQKIDGVLAAVAPQPPLADVVSIGDWADKQPLSRRKLAIGLVAAGVAVTTMIGANHDGAHSHVQDIAAAPAQGSLGLLQGGSSNFDLFGANNHTKASPSPSISMAPAPTLQPTTLPTHAPVPRLTPAPHATHPAPKHTETVPSARPSATHLAKPPITVVHTKAPTPKATHTVAATPKPTIHITPKPAPKPTPKPKPKPNISDWNSLFAATTHEKTFLSLHPTAKTLISNEGMFNGLTTNHCDSNLRSAALYQAKIANRELAYIQIVSPSDYLGHAHDSYQSIVSAWINKHYLGFKKFDGGYVMTTTQRQVASVAMARVMEAGEDAIDKQNLLDNIRTNG